MSRFVRLQEGYALLSGDVTDLKISGTSATSVPPAVANPGKHRQLLSVIVSPPKKGPWPPGLLTVTDSN